jgi:ankyrin repeat protein
LDLKEHRDHDKCNLRIIKSKSQLGFLPLVEYLFQKGANLEARDESGETALHESAKNGHSSVVTFLLAKGARLEAKTDDGNISTIFHLESTVKPVNNSHPWDSKNWSLFQVGRYLEGAHQKLVLILD